MPTKQREAPPWGGDGVCQGGGAFAGEGARVHSSEDDWAGWVEHPDDDCRRYRQELHAGNEKVYIRKLNNRHNDASVDQVLTYHIDIKATEGEVKGQPHEGTK